MQRLHLAVHLPLRNRCSENFAAMPAVPGGRHCDRCQQTVHDLSAMTPREADRFVAARAGTPTCYRYLARRDGTLVFAPEPTRAPLATIVSLSLAACTPWGPPMQPETDVPDDMPAAYESPTIIPAAPPAAPADEPEVPVTAEQPPTPVANGDVRYPRTPVAHPVHVPTPPAPVVRPDDYEEFLGGEG
jgi:hypothetical protein